MYKPGHIVPVSGQYTVVNIATLKSVGREVTVVKGEPFPPLPSGCGFLLADKTKHKR